MRKITMKRKSKTAENTKNTEPEDINNDGQTQEEDDEPNTTINSSSPSQETENGTTSKKTKNRKSKIADVSFAESDDDNSNEAEKRLSKKKNKKGGRKSKSSNNVEETKSNGTEDTTTTTTTTTEKDEEEEEEESYEVEKVIDQKVVKGIKYYLIRWKGYGEESDTWEPETTLECPDLVAKFLNSRKSEDSPKNKKGKKRSSVSNSKSSSPKKTKTTVSSAEDNDDDDEEETVGEYEVDRILEVYFKKNGKREFLVHWKGYNATDNTWEPEENMSCHSLIEKFMEKVNKARASDTRELRVNRQPTKHFTLSMQQTGRRLSRRNLGKQRAQYQELD